MLLLLSPWFCGTSPSELCHPVSVNAPSVPFVARRVADDDCDRGARTQKSFWVHPGSVAAAVLSIGRNTIGSVAHGRSNRHCFSLSVRARTAPLWSAGWIAPGGEGGSDRHRGGPAFVARAPPDQVGIVFFFPFFLPRNHSWCESESLPFVRRGWMDGPVSEHRGVLVVAFVVVVARSRCCYSWWWSGGEPPAVSSRPQSPRQ